MAYFFSQSIKLRPFKFLPQYQNTSMLPYKTILTKYRATTADFFRQDCHSVTSPVCHRCHRRSEVHFLQTIKVQLTSQNIKAVPTLVARSADGQRFLVMLYACTPVLRMELRLSWFYSLQWQGGVQQCVISQNCCAIKKKVLMGHTVEEKNPSQNMAKEFIKADGLCE